jgi:hypothetical protein
MTAKALGALRKARTMSFGNMVLGRIATTAIEKMSVQDPIVSA